MDNEMIERTKTAPKFKPHKCKVRDHSLSVQTIPLMLPDKQLSVSRYSQKDSPRNVSAYTYINRFKIFPQKALPLTFDLHCKDFHALLQILKHGKFDAQFGSSTYEMLTFIRAAELENIRKQECEINELREFCKPYLNDPQIAHELQQIEQTFQARIKEMEAEKATIKNKHSDIIKKWSYDSDFNDINAENIPGASMSISYRTRHDTHKNNYTPWQIRIENYQLCKTHNSTLIQKNKRIGTILLSHDQFKSIVACLVDDLNQLISCKHLDK